VVENGLARIDLALKRIVSREALKVALQRRVELV